MGLVRRNVGMYLLGLGIFGLLIINNGCSEPSNDSDTKGLQVQTTLNASALQKSQEVVIWYINENIVPQVPNFMPSPAQLSQMSPYAKNWYGMMNAFRQEALLNDSKTSPVASGYLRGMEDDLSNSLIARQGNERQLIKLLCDNFNNEKTGLILFSNARIKGNVIHYCKPGQPLQMHQFKDDELQKVFNGFPGYKNDLVLRDNPLAQKAALNWALKLTKELKEPSGRVVFPTEIYSYSLLASGHGGAEWALTPKPVPNIDIIMQANKGTPNPMKKFMNDFAIMSEYGDKFWYNPLSHIVLSKIGNSQIVSRLDAEFQSVISGKSTKEGRKSTKEGRKSTKEGRKSTKEGRKSTKEGRKSTKEGRKGIFKEGRKAADDEFGTLGANYAFQIRGIKKTELVDVLLSHGDMIFSLVFVDSCGSFLSPELEARMKDKNVGALFTSDKDGVPWVVVEDYTKVINPEDLNYVWASSLIKGQLSVLAEQDENTKD